MEPLPGNGAAGPLPALHFMESKMHIGRYAPGFRLRPYVKNFFIFELENIDQLFYVPAWAKTMLIFHYGDRFAFRYEDGREMWTNGASFLGCTTSPFFYGGEPRPRMKFLTAEFYPLVLKALVGAGLDQFTDRNVALGDVFSRSGADRIPEALAEAVTDRAKIEIVEAFLYPLCASLRYTPPPVAREMMHRLYTARGVTDMGRLARELGITDRHLRRLFKQVTGIAPKKYSLLVRAEFILSRLFQDQNANLLDLAHEFGYFDQAHFINEFKHTTLATPGEMTREQYLESVRLFYS